MAKILLVDDDVRLARALDDWLTAEGHDVEVINEGKAAFKRALEEPFQVLILDWDVPGMSGVEICQQYLESGGTGRVIMLTGKTAVKDRVKGLDAGADDYLTKPFNPEELSARVRALSRRAQTDSKPAVQKAIKLWLSTSRTAIERGIQRFRTCQIECKRVLSLAVFYEQPKPGIFLERPAQQCVVTRVRGLARRHPGVYNKNSGKD